MVTKDFNTLVGQLVEKYSTSQSVHANSLVLTIFGDYICSHGGVIWLGSIIKIVEPLGISQRLVRTAVYRLTEKGILQSKQLGRRSFYSLTEKGFRQFSSAAGRIYRYQQTPWDGEWRLVFTTLKNISKKDKDKFQNELVWLGFNRLSSGVYAHPLTQVDVVNKIVTEMKLDESVVVMQAKSMGSNPLKSSGNMIKQCFNFDVMKQEYLEFINFFSGILKTTESSQTKSDEMCFLLRTLLIHKYRHILLREPELPRELIPEDCLSHRAREITEKLYKLICIQAEAYFLQVGEAEDGNLPKLDKEFFTRFGGISR